MEAYGSIYAIIDGTNDFEYIGQTTKAVEKRFKEHTKADTRIGYAIRAHGKDMFVVVVLKVCHSKDELDYWERRLIKSRDSKHPNGYNLTDGGEGGIPCDETRAKMSVTRKGKKKSPETCAKLSVALRGEKNPRYGKKNTPEHQAKIVASNLGKKRTLEQCANISAALIGKPFTIKRCTNISVANRAYSPFKNLLAELDARQMSYAALAKLLGLSAGKVSMRMREQRNFTERDKVKLVEIFGKPIEYLLERDEEPNCEENFVTKRKSPYKNLLIELAARQMSYAAIAKLLGLSDAPV